MKRSSRSAFTLVEMVTVVAVIVILAGLIISVSGYVNTKAAKERALNEITAFASACEAYKLDNGAYPQTEDTDLLDPRVHFSPTKYDKANLDFYSALSGDVDPPKQPDGKLDQGRTAYFNFTRDKLNFSKNVEGQIKEIKYVQDPFGSPYGYSTAGAKAESDYRAKLKVNPSEARDTNKKGFNPTFDLWSTAGGTTQAHQVKWVRNWGS
jgi:prepilin-type N-terminal cleavage/methylation domain-containing protein